MIGMKTFFSLAALLYSMLKLDNEENFFFFALLLERLVMMHVNCLERNTA